MSVHWSFLKAPQEGLQLLSGTSNSPHIPKFLTHRSGLANGRPLMTAGLLAQAASHEPEMSSSCAEYCRLPSPVQPPALNSPQRSARACVAVPRRTSPTNTESQERFMVAPPAR